MKWYIVKTAVGLPPKFAQAMDVINSANLRRRYQAVVNGVNAVQSLLDEKMADQGNMIPKGFQNELAKVISAGQLFAKAFRAQKTPASKESLDGMLQQLQQTATVAAQAANQKGEAASVDNPFAMQPKKAPRRVEPTLFDESAQLVQPPPEPEPDPSMPTPGFEDIQQRASSSGQVRMARPMQPTLPFPAAPEAAPRPPAPTPPRAARQREVKAVFYYYLENVAKKCQEVGTYQPVNGQMILNDLLRYYKMGENEGGKDWYGKMFSICQQKLGPENAKKFMALIAATSPRTGVFRNLEHAIEAFNKHVQGENTFDMWQDGNRYIKFMSTHLPNLMRALHGEDLSGPKVRSFNQALNGDPNSVTLDTWMAKALGIENESLLGKQDKYDLIADALREVASMTKAANGQPPTPRDFQAAVWTGIKKGMGDEKLSAEPIDQMMDQLWERLADDCFQGDMQGEDQLQVPQGNPFEFQGQQPATASTWVRGNCVMG